MNQNTFYQLPNFTLTGNNQELTSEQLEQVNQNVIVDSDKIVDGEVKNIDLANNAITNAKIQDFTIQGNKIAGGTITNFNYGNGSITGNKIATDTVLEANLANNSVSALKLQDNSVSVNKLQNNSVQTAKINDLAVTNQKLANNAVSELKLDDLSISTNKIQDDAVDNTKVSKTLNQTDNFANYFITDVNTAFVQQGGGYQDKLWMFDPGFGLIQFSYLRNSNIQDAVITGSKLVNGTIPYTKVDIFNVPADGQLLSYNQTQDKFLWINPPTSSIADNSITVLKLIDNINLNSKLALNSIGYDKLNIPDDSIPQVKLQQFANNSLSGNVIANNSFDYINKQKSEVSSINKLCQFNGSGQPIISKLNKDNFDGQLIDNDLVVDNSLNFLTKLDQTTLTFVNFPDSSLNYTKFNTNGTASQNKILKYQDSDTMTWVNTVDTISLDTLNGNKLINYSIDYNKLNLNTPGLNQSISLITGSSSSQFASSLLKYTNLSGNYLTIGAGDAYNESFGGIGFQKHVSSPVFIYAGSSSLPSLVQFFNNGGNNSTPLASYRGAIVSSGGTLAFQQPCTRDIKYSIETKDPEGVLDKFMNQLKIRTYITKDSLEKLTMGVIYEEIQDVFGYMDAGQLKLHRDYTAEQRKQKIDEYRKAINENNTDGYDKCKQIQENQLMYYSFVAMQEFYKEFKNQQKEHDEIKDKVYELSFQPKTLASKEVHAICQDEIINHLQQPQTISLQSLIPTLSSGLILNTGDMYTTTQQIPLDYVQGLEEVIQSQNAQIQENNQQIKLLIKTVNNLTAEIDMLSQRLSIK